MHAVSTKTDTTSIQVRIGKKKLGSTQVAPSGTNLLSQLSESRPLLIQAKFCILLAWLFFDYILFHFIHFFLFLC